MPSTISYLPPTRTVDRTAIMYCVIPADLGHHYDALRCLYHGSKQIKIVVERRAGGRRRSAFAPAGTERRVSDRRDGFATQTAADMGFALPRQLRAHADRILCTSRSVPLQAEDAGTEANALLAAAANDGIARCELRMRFHAEVYGTVAPRSSSPRRALELTDRIFDELFAHHESSNYKYEITRATWRVLAGRRPSQRAPLGAAA